MRALALLKRSVGSLAQARAILRVTVYLQSAQTFRQQSEVADAASEILVDVLGPAGPHSRTSVGVFQLPKIASRFSRGPLRCQSSNSLEDQLRSARPSVATCRCRSHADQFTINSIAVKDHSTRAGACFGSKLSSKIRIQHHPVPRLARAQVVQRLVHLAHGEMLHLRRNAVAGAELHHLGQYDG